MYRPENNSLVTFSRISTADAPPSVISYASLPLFLVGQAVRFSTSTGCAWWKPRRSSWSLKERCKPTRSSSSRTCERGHGMVFSFRSPAISQLSERRLEFEPRLFSNLSKQSKEAKTLEVRQAAEGNFLNPERTWEPPPCMARAGTGPCWQEHDPRPPPPPCTFIRNQQVSADCALFEHARVHLPRTKHER